MQTRSSAGKNSYYVQSSSGKLSHMFESNPNGYGIVPHGHRKSTISLLSGVPPKE